MSIGVVIVTHYELGEQFLQALRLIVPDAPTFYSVSAAPDQPVDELRKAIGARLSEAESGDGVLVLTDMFGGTPSNMSLSFLDEHFFKYRIDFDRGVGLSQRFFRISGQHQQLGGEQQQRQRCLCRVQLVGDAQHRRRGRSQQCQGDRARHPERRCLPTVSRLARWRNLLSP